LLLEKLSTNVAGIARIYGYGEHKTGQKSVLGEGRIVGFRKYQLGDGYRDISLRQTIKNTIRKRKVFELKREDITVKIKDIRRKIDIFLVVDLSGTMRQPMKLWYAKESTLALSLAASLFGDKAGLITFSNLAEKVVDLTDNTHNLIRNILKLKLHENAFTNIGAGILKAIKWFGYHKRSVANQHIILISDGDATAPHPSPQKYALRQASKAVRKGITISCICINESSADTELMKLISRIGKGRIYITNPEQLSDKVIQEFLRRKYGTH
jgi:Mg-chelatase subunit ChlD